MVSQNSSAPESQRQQNRLQQLQAWIKTVFPTQTFALSLLAGDASFRCYYRLLVTEDTETTAYVVMDAPPEKEDTTPFIAVAELLRAKVHVPKIIAKDITQGFLLLEDLGDTMLASELSQQSVNELYTLAMQEIIAMQTLNPAEAKLPLYDDALLTKEMQLFSDWFLPFLDIHLTAKQSCLWQNVIQQINFLVRQQPQGVVHRDYHSRNLMLLDAADKDINKHGQAAFWRVGVIDFQDAVIGAYTYDVVSLLRDAYVAWQPAQVNVWLKQFWHMQQQAGITTAKTEAAFLQDANVMSLQRHIKVLGIFVRLSERDGKTQYLTHLPQVFAYVVDEIAALIALLQANVKLAETTYATAITVFTDFSHWLEQSVKPKLTEKQ